MALFNMHSVAEKARDSSFYRTLLNFGLKRMIPFNRPHGIKITELGEKSIQTILPFKKANLNHIRSLHACSMATLAEFTTGFLLVSKLDTSKYRLIMKKIAMEFHYQGKMDAFANFEIHDQWMKERILDPLEKSDNVDVECEVIVVDKEGNKLATAIVTWQMKNWNAVKTKV